MKILFVIVLFLIFTGCIMFDQNDNYPLSKGEELVNSTLYKFKRQARASLVTQTCTQ